MIVLVALIGRAIAGPGGMMIAFLIAIGMNFVSYWFSDKIVLRMYGAEEVSRSEAPELYEMVDRLRKNADLPMPRVCVIPSDQPNAFATGRNPENAVVAVTKGIVKRLSTAELEGVVAHELAHIKNRDILTSSIAATLAAAVTMLARFGFFFGGHNRENALSGLFMLILAPIAAMLIQMAISRSREYAADRDGGKICGNPGSLADALERMERDASSVPMDANQATSHMFIVNPFTGRLGGITRLFSTHPPTEERVKRLREMNLLGS
jgi:heat shock protein HtpX